MKKFVAFAFVAGMVAFASCTSKPKEEAADSTAVTVETPIVDTVAVELELVVDNIELAVAPVAVAFATFVIAIEGFAVAFPSVRSHR